MLRANTKQAKENLKAVMLRECSGWDADPQTAEEAAFILAHDFIEANKGPSGKIYLEEGESYQDAFMRWGQGLTNHIFDKLFYFGEARSLLAEVLQETPEEAAKFTEAQAAEKFCAFMWIHGGVSECFYKLYKGGNYEAF